MNYTKVSESCCHDCRRTSVAFMTAVSSGCHTGSKQLGALYTGRALPQPISSWGPTARRVLTSQAGLLCRMCTHNQIRPVGVCEDAGPAGCISDVCGQRGGRLLQEAGLHRRHHPAPRAGVLLLYLQHCTSSAFHPRMLHCSAGWVSASDCMAMRRPKGHRVGCSNQCPTAPPAVAGLDQGL